MAITTVLASDIDPTFSVTTGAAYLGAGNYIEVVGADAVEISGSSSTIAMTIKWSFDGGSTFNNERVMAANEVYEIEDIGGRVVTIDAKAASGSPTIDGTARK